MTPLPAVVFVEGPVPTVFCSYACRRGCEHPEQVDLVRAIDSMPMLPAEAWGNWDTTRRYAYWGYRGEGRPLKGSAKEVALSYDERVTERHGYHPDYEPARRRKRVLLGVSDTHETRASATKVKSRRRSELKECPHDWVVPRANGKGDRLDPDRALFRARLLAAKAPQVTCHKCGATMGVVV